jgi:anti-sigma regulatory factor (Ser/Thr protein kinase)
MINLDMTFEDMKKEIGFSKYIFNSVLSPNSNPEWFTNTEGFYEFNEDLMFSSILKKFPNKEVDVNFSTAFSELDYNASMHGNKDNPYLKYGIKVGLGSQGYIAQVIDEGKGFNLYNAIKNSRLRKDTSPGGVGFKLFDQNKKVVVSWEGKKNNIANLMYKFPKKELDFSQRDDLAHLVF